MPDLSACFLQKALSAIIMLIEGYRSGQQVRPWVCCFGICREVTGVGTAGE